MLPTPTTRTRNLPFRLPFLLISPSIPCPTADGRGGNVESTAVSVPPPIVPRTEPQPRHGRSQARRRVAQPRSRHARYWGANSNSSRTPSRRILSPPPFCLPKGLTPFPTMSGVADVCPNEVDAKLS